MTGQLAQIRRRPDCHGRRLRVRPLLESGEIVPVEIEVLPYQPASTGSSTQVSVKRRAVPTCLSRSRSY